jgi:hypothetical protein
MADIPDGYPTFMNPSRARDGASSFVLKALIQHRARMTSRRSRNKGVRTELSTMNVLMGVAAVRVPLSEAVGGRFSGDIVLTLAGRDLCVEVKAKVNGFRELNKRDMLIVKADRPEPLVAELVKLVA